MSGKQKRGKTLKTQALPPFSKYLQETHRTHFRLQKRQTIKTGQKRYGSQSGAVPFCFRTHPFRFPADLCKSRIWLGRGRQPVRQNAFNRYALGNKRPELDSRRRLFQTLSLLRALADSIGALRQLFGAVGGDERLDHLVHPAVEEGLDGVQRQPDAVVGHPVPAGNCRCGALAAVAGCRSGCVARRKSRARASAVQGRRGGFSSP